MVLTTNPFAQIYEAIAMDMDLFDDVAVGNDLDSALVANRRGHDEAAASRPWHGEEESRPYDAWAESPGTSEASRDGEEGSHP